MKLVNLALGLAAAVACLAPKLAEASNYPPDYDICSIDDYAYTGPFELIRDTVRFNGHAQLTVAYRGYLRDLYPEEDINIYVSLNGQDAFVGASAGLYDDAYIFLDSGPRACVWCSANPQQNPAACDGVVIPEYSGGIWHCEDPTALEQHLFHWAFNEWGQQNAWDIWLAAEANGQWDSNWGNNYYARFEPRNACY